MGITSIEETRPMRRHDGGLQTAKIVVSEDATDRNKVYITGMGYGITLYNKPPEDFDRKPYWLIYTTMWNNYAHYGDENNSNKAYELACYADCEFDASKDYDKAAALLNDFVSMVMEKQGGEPALQRVSHAILRKSGSLSVYEKCFSPALKTKKIRVWEGFIF